ncbi:MAG TPA: c-type cytochrome [Burkholderiales bacterium]|nr:c-type cytochrome [Burkholderiales bacterium]
MSRAWAHERTARRRAPRRVRQLLLILFAASALLGASLSALARPTIDELKARAVLDDYEANIVFGYNIVMETSKYAGRYAGSSLSCTSCHLRGGTQPDGFPLNVAGVYPKWRAKNGVRNGIGMRIRDCFLYSLNGIMPPEESPEVLAVAAYVSYLSEGEVIGRPPKGWGVPTLPDTGADPNPPRGQAIYQRVCAVCHGAKGEGQGPVPAVWGLNSFNAGAGLNNVQKLAGFIWANMPMGNERSLSYQEALDVAAFINLQYRAFDPREGRLKKLAERIYHRLTLIFGKDNP